MPPFVFARASSPRIALSARTWPAFACPAVSGFQEGESPRRGYNAGMYETFEHTADLGLRIRAADLESLFTEAGRALFSVLVDDLSTVQPAQAQVLEVKGDDRVYLLFDWLNELLYRFETEHWLFSRFEVRFDEQGLVGTAWGEPVDTARHALAHEVKAITYHGLRVEPSEGGWLAELIVDI
jgi:SHS2 domain-containing protein